MFDILHWPLLLSNSAISQGETLHGIKYRMQFKRLDVYIMQMQQLMIG